MRRKDGDGSKTREMNAVKRVACSGRDMGGERA